MSLPPNSVPPLAEFPSDATSTTLPSLPSPLQQSQLQQSLPTFPSGAPTSFAFHQSVSMYRLPHTIEEAHAEIHRLNATIAAKESELYYYKSQLSVAVQHVGLLQRQLAWAHSQIAMLHAHVQRQSAKILQLEQRFAELDQAFNNRQLATAVERKLQDSFGATLFQIRENLNLNRATKSQTDSVVAVLGDVANLARVVDVFADFKEEANVFAHAIRPFSADETIQALKDHITSAQLPDAARVGLLAFIDTNRMAILAACRFKQRLTN